MTHNPNFDKNQNVSRKVQFVVSGLSLASYSS